MVRLTLRLPQVDDTADRPASCRYCGSTALQRWGLHQRRVRDPLVGVAWVARYRCKSCGRTFRAYPKGVGRGQQTQRVKVLAAALWASGLSLRRATALLSANGVDLSHQTVWESAMNLAREVGLRRLDRPVKVLDPLSPAGRPAPDVEGLILAMDIGAGPPLELRIAEERDVQAIVVWLAPLVESFQAEVVVDDLGGAHRPG